MREIEIERISYHIQASIKRSKNRNRKRKKVLFVSDLDMDIQNLWQKGLWRKLI